MIALTTAGERILKTLNSWGFLKSKNNIDAANSLQYQSFCDSKVELELIKDCSLDRILMYDNTADNALDFLLKNPKKITLITNNEEQKHYVNLKLCLYNRGSHQLLFAFFGKGFHKTAKNEFNKFLKNGLSQAEVDYWNKNIHIFGGDSYHKPFYFQGINSEYHKKINLLFTKTLTNLNLTYRGVHENVNKYIPYILNSDNFYAFIEIMEAIMLEQIQPRVGFFPQKNLTKNYHEYIKQRLKGIFGSVDFENYHFWRAFFSGTYSRNICPNYLLVDNFETIAENINKLEVRHNDLLTFLKNTRRKFSLFLLFDYLDKIPKSEKGILINIFKEIVKKSTPNTRIFIRSNVYNYQDLLSSIPVKMELRALNESEVTPFDSIGLHKYYFVGSLNFD